MDGFGCSDGQQIAVALVTDNQLIFLCAFDAGRNSGRSSVRSFNAVDINVVVRQNSAADRSNQNGFFPAVHFIQTFADEFMNDSVSASGTVMTFNIPNRFRACV